MQKCYNCGKEVDDNVLICPDCGALVKRYGKPVPVEPDSYHQQPQPDAYPGAYEAPAQPGPRERVWLDAAGKPHFKGALCFWLIVCAVFAGYLLFGFGCMLLIYHAQGFFLDALAAFPEFSDLTDVLNLMLESIGTYYAFYVAVPVLFAVKLFGIVWLLVSKRRLAFYIALGAGVLLTVTSLLFGGSVLEDLRAGAGHVAAVHLKETVPGVFREVPYGSGHVDFAGITKTAMDMGVRRFLAEFWYDGRTDWKQMLRDNNRFLRHYLDQAEEAVHAKPTSGAEKFSL